MSNGQFPDTLVLPFTAIHSSSSGCDNGLAAQIAQGNTFSAAFDMTQAPHAPQQNGDVTLRTEAQSNFQASSAVVLDNEGMADTISFFSDGATEAVIFGQPFTVAKIWLQGTPNGEVFTWQAAMWIGENCIVTNVVMGDDALARTGR
jgi:hypothetical protein